MTARRRIASALATVAFCIAIWWLIEWRSAAPPPPDIPVDPTLPVR